MYICSVFYEPPVIFIHLPIGKVGTRFWYSTMNSGLLDLVAHLGKKKRMLSEFFPSPGTSVYKTKKFQPLIHGVREV